MNCSGEYGDYPGITTTICGERSSQFRFRYNHNMRWCALAVCAFLMCERLRMCVSFCRHMSLPVSRPVPACSCACVVCGVVWCGWVGGCVCGQMGFCVNTQKPMHAYVYMRSYMHTSGCMRISRHRTVLCPHVSVGPAWKYVYMCMDAQMPSVEHISISISISISIYIYIYACVCGVK